jgi:peptide deformylase
MRLKIVQVGEAVLRQQAKELSVAEIRGREIQGLIESMRETMHDAPGVGLAAPQIGVPLQLAVIEDKPENLKDIPVEYLKERERKAVPFHVIVNPKLVLEGPSDLEFFEGCLSLASFTAVVPRARKIRVECLDHKGEPRIIEASGWYARILQHEIDHLHGVLCVDRMDPRTLSTHANYSKHWRGKSSDEIRARLLAPRR